MFRSPGVGSYSATTALRYYCYYCYYYCYDYYYYYVFSQRYRTQQETRDFSALVRVVFLYFSGLAEHIDRDASLIQTTTR